MDLVGVINPPSVLGHKWILAATDYFSKWSEAIPLREATANAVANFIKQNINHRFGVPERIVSDNGKQFIGKPVQKLCEEFKMRHHKSSSYYPQANGQAEAFNKTLTKLLRKIVSKNRKDWHDKLGDALWAYRTTIRTATGATPYALVYEAEAVLPVEIKIPSLRTAAENGLYEEENSKSAPS